MLKGNGSTGKVMIAMAVVLMLLVMMVMMMMMMRTNLTTTMSFTTSQLIIQNLAYELVLLSINLSYDKGFI